jgi:hypothetical protein
VEASNDVARKYYDETPKKEKNDTEIIAIMRAAAKSKQQSFKGQFSKYLIIVNPKFRDKFLQEVSSSYHTLWQYILIHY